MNSNEKEVMLKSYRKEIELLVLKVEIPDIKEYEDTLLRLFNNKREDRCILNIQNWYGSNDIAIYINLTEYDDGDNRQKSIEHLKQWFIGRLDIAEEKIEVEIGKAFIYEIPDYLNDFEWFTEDEKFIRNYVRIEE